MENESDTWEKICVCVCAHVCSKVNIFDHSPLNFVTEGLRVYDNSNLFAQETESQLLTVSNQTEVHLFLRHCWMKNESITQSINK